MRTDEPEHHLDVVALVKSPAWESWADSWDDIWLRLFEPGQVQPLPVLILWLNK